MTNKKPMQEELLDKVAGGVEIGIPAGGSNTHQYNKEEMDRIWEVLKQRMEWKFKSQELEIQAKKIWIDAGLDLAKTVMGSGTVKDVIMKLVGNVVGGGGAAAPAAGKK